MAAMSRTVAEYINRTGCPFAEQRDFIEVDIMMVRTTRVADLFCERTALRAFGNVGGTVLIVDRDHRRVLWSPMHHDAAKSPEYQDAIVNAAERLLAASANDDPLPTPARSPWGMIASAVPTSHRQRSETHVVPSCTCSEVRVAAFSWSFRDASVRLFACS
jgi:hypothetical protein